MRAEQRHGPGSSQITVSARAKRLGRRSAVVAVDDPPVCSDQCVVLVSPLLLGWHGAVAPVPVVEVNDGQAGDGSELACERRLAGSHGADDRDALHVVHYRRRADPPIGHKARRVCARLAA
jgi:hypothetical protein